ncbi:metal-sensitive transcriptional regulator [Paeniglutamicibacter kerguelensis]|uniref:DNA-binding FrmR family transcriptional regulator n=1 Tax=Paeniglutamicibacter kerguelensis TaxID=254788 RepID=A0ABS4XET9_9MICC|nr:metal-sensitive transcriptional regulator [Paeniglutamicibacter kerguelensis]MBP2386987.1 DNA-binding FrmR family transcriptional regulator [Paeniglutamicibacter kerguelensis]
MELDPVELKPVLNRLKRAQGQLGAVIRMIEDGQECADVITQLSAASKALDRAGFSIIASGLQSCMQAEANEEGAGTLDRQKLEKLFLSLA